MFKKVFSTLKCWFTSSKQEVPVIYRHGDINHDGKVDISDVTKLINMILGSEDPNNMADVNGDGKVDQSDVTRLIEIINTDNGDDGFTCVIPPKRPDIKDPADKVSPDADEVSPNKPEPEVATRKEEEDGTDVQVFPRFKDLDTTMHSNVTDKGTNTEKVTPEVATTTKTTKRISKKK